MTGIFYGLNTRYPWSRLIIKKEKTIETRNYTLSSKKINTPICLIETKGFEKNSPVKKAQIIGVIKIKNVYKYRSLRHWNSEFAKHKAPAYLYNKKKWAWEVEVVKAFKKPKKAPKIKGIVWAKKCVLR